MVAPAVKPLEEIPRNITPVPESQYNNIIKQFLFI
jgi:hypothetical protein